MEELSEIVLIGLLFIGLVLAYIGWILTQLHLAIVEVSRRKHVHFWHTHISFKKSDDKTIIEREANYSSDYQKWLDAVFDILHNNNYQGDYPAIVLHQLFKENTSPEEAAKHIYNL